MDQAVFASAVKHSRLLGDFLEIVVGEQYRLFGTALTDKLSDDYLQGCRERDADTPPLGARQPAPGYDPRCSTRLF